MRNTKIYVVLLIVIIVLVSGTLVTFSSVNQTHKLSVQVQVAKNVFALGEVVNLNVVVRNISNTDVVIAGNAIEAGVLKVFISKNGDKYRRYTFGGKIGGDNTVFKPGETTTFQKSVIYNPAPRYSHLNKDAAKDMDDLENRILTNYAFPEAGVYSIKVVFHYRNIEDNKNIYKPDNTVESAPIQITVVEPVGEDREIWHFIKDKPEFAYFMESDEPPYNPEKRALFQQNLQQIIDHHPNSFIVRQLKQSIEKFNQNEARRNDPRNKIIRQPNRPDPQ